jgi:predicted RecA/RadA family phage recombinase
MSLKAQLFKEGAVLDYTAAANKLGGDVVAVAGLCGVLVDDVANGYSGSAQVQGLVKVEKKQEALAAGADVWYDADGNPYLGTAGTGAATGTPCSGTGDVYMGKVPYAAAANDTHCYVLLNARKVGNRTFASANVADSAEVENTVVETAFDKIATLVGASLSAGDHIRVRALALVNDNSGADTLTLKLYAGTEEICSTGAVDVADGDIGFIDADIAVRIAGAGGHLAACGLVGLGIPGTVTAKPFNKADAAEDLSGNVVISVKAAWSAAHADNEVQLSDLIVEVVPAT